MTFAQFISVQRFSTFTNHGHLTNQRISIISPEGYAFSPRVITLGFHGIFQKATNRFRLVILLSCQLKPMKQFQQFDICTNLDYFHLFFCSNCFCSWFMKARNDKFQTPCYSTICFDKASRPKITNFWAQI